MNRVLLFANNALGLRVAQFFHSQRIELAGLVVHPDSKARFKAEIVAACQLGEHQILEASLLETHGEQWIQSIGATLGVSAAFAYILRAPILAALPRGIANIHTSLLPYNRGVYPNVWSIVEKTPAGVTLHWIDGGVDTGEIIAARAVDVEPFDTGKTLYEKLEDAAVELFRESWPAIASGNASSQKQQGSGSFHRYRDVEAIDCIDLDATYRAGDLIDILRARTFPPYLGAYFVHNGRKIYLRLELEGEDEDL